MKVQRSFVIYYAIGLVAGLLMAFPEGVRFDFEDFWSFLSFFVSTIIFALIIAVLLNFIFEGKKRGP
jgi:xanthine/uracil permease